MPTVEAFLRAAALFEEAAVDARRLVEPARAAMGPQVLRGGRLTTSTEAALVARTADAQALSQELLRLTSECRTRAAATAVAAAEAEAFADAIGNYDVRRRSYDRRLAEHQADPSIAHPGRAPTRPPEPPTPPTWADF